MNSSGHYALYAELLANIRQISLAASLPSASDASTQVALSADGRTVELRHGGRDHHLTLPAKAGLGGTLLPIQDKQKGTRALSWRLPLDAASLSPSHQADHTPWSATDLGPDSGVACRQCSTNVVPAGSVKAWKDLPSENWAEMMEFWHCHKPDHHHSHEEETGKADEQTLAARGYGASSVISAQEGVGFVDLTTLLFAESDCRSVTFSLSTFEQGSTDRQRLPSTDATPQPRSLNVFCSSCQTQLGFFNLRTSAVTLLKWQISSQSTSGAVPGIPECLAATLISTISRSGSSKSLITPILIPVQDDAIHIWVLNSSIVYSSSSSSNSSNSSNSSSSNAAPQQRTPAIKLLYRAIPCAEADKLLEAVTCDAQEINLPAQALREVLRHLGESNARLPPTERVFKEWKVGLLTRWESKVV
ncbi:ubiquitin-conjugating enzyme E2-binding protein [Chaetomidium leptoderma]|uniref:Ubiquitin-conjugating enzyme E2-binding protein n=1 Tax=Chaetomidium leptoderma TaxID=669021 RepID=A0AAN6ZTD4_9PEZI|nr:ubiquitin-conjugating enzyme E2-binding protein [Chaetomidium leptoderma]